MYIWNNVFFFHEIKEFGFLLPPSEILLTANSVHNGIKRGLRVISTFQHPPRHLI
jgi:hypothetical protein